MYLVRDPRRDVGDGSSYDERDTRSDAYSRVAEVGICTRCGRDLGQNLGDRQVVIEYPSAIQGSEDVYLTVACFDCAPDVMRDVVQAEDLRAGDHFAYPAQASRSWLDPVVAEQRAIQASQGITPELLSDAARAVEEVGEDELERAALDAENRHPQGYGSGNPIDDDRGQDGPPRREDSDSPTTRAAMRRAYETMDLRNLTLDTLEDLAETAERFDDTVALAAFRDVIRSRRDQDVPPPPLFDAAHHERYAGAGHWSQFYTAWHEGDYRSCSICHPKD